MRALHRAFSINVSRRTWLGSIALAGLLLSMSAFAPSVAAQETSSCVVTVPRCACSLATRPGDSLWLVSTRGLGCPNPAASPNLPCWRFDCKAGWQSVPLSELLAEIKGPTPTAFYVHGNQTDSELAKQIGREVYETLVAGQPADKPLRLVVWSWPSDRVEGTQLNDVRVKAPRADTTGYYLAWFLDQLDPHAPITLIGYSYGSRAISAALEMTAGGTSGGYALAKRIHPNRAPVNAVLVASAMDSDWLLPGRRDELALSQMQKLLLINNSCDRALKFYHFLYCRKSCAEALGYVGLSTWSLSAADQAKVTQVDACCMVGSEHDWSNYVHSASLMARVRPLVFAAP